MPQFLKRILIIRSIFTLKQLRKLLIISLSFLLCAVVSAISWDSYVSWKTKSQIFTSVDAIPDSILDASNPSSSPLVALVLGTSKYIRTGGLNSYYLYRLDTAEALYKKNNNTHFLLSGDNALVSYNEPKAMNQDLMKRNIPSEQLHLDYAGFRTLDSIVRASTVFDIQKEFIIISQRFHCERALYIANHFKTPAICLVAPTPSSSKQSNLIRLREVFARIKMGLDLYLLNSQPKFLGPKEPIY